MRFGSGPTSPGAGSSARTAAGSSRAAGRNRWGRITTLRGAGGGQSNGAAGLFAAPPPRTIRTPAPFAPAHPRPGSSPVTDTPTDPAAPGTRDENAAAAGHRFQVDLRGGDRAAERTPLLRPAGRGAGTAPERGRRPHRPQRRGPGLHPRRRGGHAGTAAGPQAVGRHDRPADAVRAGQRRGADRGGGPRVPRQDRPQHQAGRPAGEQLHRAVRHRAAERVPRRRGDRRRHPLRRRGQRTGRVARAGRRHLLGSHPRHRHRTRHAGVPAGAGGAARSTSSRRCCASGPRRTARCCRSPCR